MWIVWLENNRIWCNILRKLLLPVTLLNILAEQKLSVHSITQLNKIFCSQTISIISKLLRFLLAHFPNQFNHTESSAKEFITCNIITTAKATTISGRKMYHSLVKHKLVYPFWDIYMYNTIPLTHLLLWSFELHLQAFRGVLGPRLLSLRNEFPNATRTLHTPRHIRA